MYDFLYVINAFGSCRSDISRDIRRVKVKSAIFTLIMATTLAKM
jgi:hypothetical protein